MWAGVDVGGSRKGFHAALVDEHRLVRGPQRLGSAEEAAAWLAGSGAILVAVDSPRRCAPDGLRSRPDERALSARVCGIRYTPDAATVHDGGRYYEWIHNGLRLYLLLEQARLEAIECFPTASLTRWGGPRGAASRAVWSRRVLATLELAGVPARLSQDGRDAIAAALTARAHAYGETETFGEIVVARNGAAGASRAGPAGEARVSARNGAAGASRAGPAGEARVSARNRPAG